MIEEIKNIETEEVEDRNLIYKKMLGWSYRFTAQVLAVVSMLIFIKSTNFKLDATVMIGVYFLLVGIMFYFALNLPAYLSFNSRVDIEYFFLKEQDLENMEKGMNIGLTKKDWCDYSLYFVFVACYSCFRNDVFSPETLLTNLWFALCIFLTGIYIMKAGVFKPLEDDEDKTEINKIK
ncbi:hypothetical protein RF542_27270 [Pseudomonas aeruginosa]